MTQKAPDHCSILLLDSRLVVLAVLTRTGEPDAPVDAALGEGVVDEHAVVVAVDAENRNGQLFGDGHQSYSHQGLLLNQQRHRLGPSGADPI